jgi:deoxyribodipyrimidine photo-lyase
MGLPPPRVRTGVAARPNRVLNPVRQGRRYDPGGAYVRRWVPELRGLDGPAVHEPWRSREADSLDYPSPIVDLDEGTDRFRRARGRG